MKPLTDPRCKHDVHGTDCYECYHSEGAPNGADAASLEERCSEQHQRCAYLEALLTSKDERIRLDRNKISWQASLLERAKPFLAQLVKDYAKSETKVEQKWLSDLEKGPTE